MTVSPFRTTPGTLGIRVVIGLVLIALALAVIGVRSDTLRDRAVHASGAGIADELARQCNVAGIVAWTAAMDAHGAMLSSMRVRVLFVDPNSDRLLHQVGAVDVRGVRAISRVGEPLTWLLVTVEVEDPRRRAWAWPLSGATVAACAITLLLAHRAGQRSIAAASKVARAADELAGGNLTSVRRIPAHGELEAVGAALERLVRQIGPRLSHLQNLSAEQQAILESMGSGLIAIDPDQRILSLNGAAATLLGIDGARVRGRLVQEVARHPSLNQFITEAISAQAAIDGEFPMERDKGGRILVRAVSEPLRDPGGRPAGLLVVLTDITTLRRLETLRADFAANVSHELRTPITNIKGYVETLLQVGFDDHEQASRFLGIVQRNAHRLATIIEDLLALTRLEQPGVRETLERATMAARGIAESVVTHLAPTAEAKGIELVTDVPEALEVRVMPTLIEQALANLVANAITYSPSETTVRVVGRRRSSGWVELAVIDEGPGIPAHHLSRIFERFYRVDKARSRDHGGTGLGLAIVKHIALVHGGKVEVESRVGAGSTFRLLLPEPVDAPGVTASITPKA